MNVSAFAADVPAQDNAAGAIFHATVASQVLAAATPQQISTAKDPPPHPPPPPAATVPGDASPEVVAVYTAEALQEAFHAGVRDIEIHDHLDLRDLPTEEPRISVSVSAPEHFQLGHTKPTTRSIRGKCTSPPPAPLDPAALGLNITGPEPWRAPRCVLISTIEIFWVDWPGLWIDGLHLQLTSRSDSESTAAISIGTWGSVYLTDSVVQGEPAAHATGLQLYQCGLGAYVQVD
eukprot:jgi/Ulvmu1/3761/UM175_0009.1